MEQINKMKVTDNVELDRHARQMVECLLITSPELFIK